MVIPKAFHVLFSLIVLIIFSCCKNSSSQNEDIRVIGFVSNRPMYINDSTALEIPYFHYLLFTYHDTIFKIETDTSGNNTFFMLKCRKAALDSLHNKLRIHNEINLADRSAQKNPGRRGCGPEGYTMFFKEDSLLFNVFSSREFYEWDRFARYQEVKLHRNQFPKVYRNIQSCMEGKMLKYYFSDAYLYKELRIHSVQILSFAPSDNKP